MDSSRFGERSEPKHWTVEIGKTSGGFVVRAQYGREPVDRTTGDKVAGIDLGEKHLATVFTGDNTERRYVAKRKYVGSDDQARLPGVMASPSGVRFHPHLSCSSRSRRKTQSESDRQPV
jgi:transposase